jgi:hypothetical protein
MRPEDRVRLLHMRDAAREAIGFAAGRTRDDLDTDRQLRVSSSRSRYPQGTPPSLPYVLFFFVLRRQIFVIAMIRHS